MLGVEDLPPDWFDAAQRLRQAGARVSVRIVSERSERLAMSRGVLEPFRLFEDAGAMVTVTLDQASGYAASADLSAAGLAQAAARAHKWALAMRRHSALAGVAIPGPDARGVRFQTVQRQALAPRSDLLELLRAESVALRRDPRILDWGASVRCTARREWLISEGELIADQSLHYVEPQLEATAVHQGVSQSRSLGGRYNAYCRQGGFEVFAESGFIDGGARVADEALQLACAPNCPTGIRDVLIDADQMMLQIHESIGHPLELDRILGDERNFAGRSFVTPAMFGSYAYGSPLLNVSFDPGVAGEFASYGVDDEGLGARRALLIENGILMRPLGGALSAARAEQWGLSVAPVASSRAGAWWRPPIDRMGNLNIEPGDASLEQMIGEVEQGVFMRTNASWSIDDSRNKFQFGCEWGQLIEGGRLTRVVRNPGYRGVSARFWRSLSRVGDRSTLRVLGTPYCGKGEPGQIVRVGHASPACLFRDVEVFGGDH